MDLTTNGHARTPAKIGKIGMAKKAAAPGKETTIVVPKMTLATVELTLNGISPLIMHAWSEKAKRMMREKQAKAATRAREIRNPEEEFNQARYLDEKKRDCIPAIAFKCAAVEAGVLVGVFKTLLRKAFFVGKPGQELIPIVSKSGPRMREDMVRVGMGSSDLRYRPEYLDWSVKVPVTFNPLMISADQLVNLFQNAGYFVGIGENRPETSGNQYGQFQVAV